VERNEYLNCSSISGEKCRFNCNRNNEIVAMKIDDGNYHEIMCIANGRICEKPRVQCIRANYREILTHLFLSKVFVSNLP